MMSVQERKLATNVVEAINSIDIHLEGKRKYEEYTANLTKRRAVERELEIIGEATSNLLKINPNIKLSYARLIENLRNRVIHSYNSIDDTIIWKVVIIDIPVLRRECLQLLSP